MKDKSQFIGILLIACAMALMFTIDHKTKSGQAPIAEAGRVGDRPATIDSESGTGGAVQRLPIASAAAEEVREERLFTIGNDVIDVTISDAGGAIKCAALKKYRALQDQPGAVMFNDGSAANALALISDDANFDRAYGRGSFAVISATENSIKLSKTLANGCVVTRQYSVAAKDGDGSDGYVVKHKTTVENGTDIPINVGNVSLCLGVMPASESDSRGDYLNFGAYNGTKDTFVKLRDFEASSGFFGLGKRQERRQILSTGKILWGSIKNKFFTAILTPATDGDGYIAWPTSIEGRRNGERKDGIAALVVFNCGIVGARGEKVFASEFYIGPKDFSRLSSFDREQSHVMQFGFFGAISELLLRMMLKIYAVVPNWGLAIIVLTTIVKLLLWPLTNAQVRSSKKMAAVQAPLKLIKEKFKNNPQKLQAETLKLFRENQINPAAGCLPIFIQIPIFFGLYYMLCTSSNLRFAHFLWIRDLSLPDTVARIGAFPVNILPLVMGATMLWQMRMAPMPTVDGSQKLMFKLMPAIFLFCCYNFPSGLVLYWTVQNLLTIAQQFTTSRKSEAQSDMPIAVPKSVGKKLSDGHAVRINKRRK
ncbi:MAG: membrane protein insertase YidC [Puniceicoccales bacterium]|jgi:YidC/Oxa1 family membrane protein insertase|nr:membrane protein insertase YidC [Puniceicoccales bacterium]